MLIINHMMPFHPQYPRPQTVITPRKDDSNDNQISFQEILNHKLDKIS
ncbi:hypothetical protein J2T13_003882 [Paenibacillus sp. DS2015]